MSRDSKTRAVTVDAHFVTVLLVAGLKFSYFIGGKYASNSGLRFLYDSNYRYNGINSLHINRIMANPKLVYEKIHQNADLYGRELPPRHPMFQDIARLEKIKGCVTPITHGIDTFYEDVGGHANHVFGDISQETCLKCKKTQPLGMDALLRNMERRGSDLCPTCNKFMVPDVSYPGGRYKYTIAAHFADYFNLEVFLSFGGSFEDVLDEDIGYEKRRILGRKLVVHVDCHDIERVMNDPTAIHVSREDFLTGLLEAEKMFQDGLTFEWDHETYVKRQIKERIRLEKMLAKAAKIRDDELGVYVPSGVEALYDKMYQKFVNISAFIKKRIPKIL